jgi:hypothetical protein
VYVSIDDEYEAAIAATIAAADAADVAADTLAADAWLSDVETFIGDAVAAFEADVDAAFEAE